jgi:tRNA pseudouridine13 synthase
MYRLKQVPEDFIVKEVMGLNFDEGGSYSYYRLTKRLYNTQDALNAVALAFRISPKFINSAGNKDRQAITCQHISISRGPRKGLDMKDLSLEYLGSGRERISLGCLQANDFEIVVRNTAKKPKRITKFRNLFDSQRFGMKENNHLVGKAIVRKDFKAACAMIDEPSIKVHLETAPNDFVGALKTIPMRTLKLYVHAYQSYLWNEMAKESGSEELPLIGFDSELHHPSLDTEGVRPMDFLIRQLPEISSEGSSRQVFANISGLEIGELQDDELNPGMKKCLAKFRLPKGAYATQAIREMFS